MPSHGWLASLAPTPGDPSLGTWVVPTVPLPPARLGRERVSNNGEVAPRVRDISLDLERAIDMTATTYSIPQKYWHVDRDEFYATRNESLKNIKAALLGGIKGDDALSRIIALDNDYLMDELLPYLMDSDNFYKELPKASVKLTGVVRQYITDVDETYYEHRVNHIVHCQA